MSHAHEFEPGVGGMSLESVCRRAGCSVLYKHVYHGWPEVLGRCPLGPSTVEKLREREETRGAVRR